MFYDEALQHAGSTTASALGALQTAKVFLHGYARPCTARWPEVTAIINSIEFDEATRDFSLHDDARARMDTCYDQLDNAVDGAWPDAPDPVDDIAMNALDAIADLTSNRVKYWEQLGVALSPNKDDYLHFIRSLAAARSRVTGETLHFTEIDDVGNVFVFDDFLPPVLAEDGPSIGARMIERAGVDEQGVTVAYEPGVVSIVGPVETVRKIYDANVQAEAAAAAARTTSPTKPAEDRADYEPLVDFTMDCPLRFEDVLDAMGNPEPTPIIDRMNWDEFLGNGYQATLSLDGQAFAATATEKDGVVTELEISPQNNASFLGIPFHIPVSRFTEKLDDLGIPWADDGRAGIVLYEHWVTLYNHDGRIEAVLWHNPETLTDIELLDLAFPPDSGN
ncbi:hypothetical protein HMPREF3151_07795 [Corynebacterium sp. HMSC05H05]|uniref:hypothetical protein n=1 Tax=unclassified Corynebacterium TaxID=2624378 RepID=UPI0008A2AB08|nr:MULTISPECIES: hypothetical protein [unclassified Corynebacterium]OFT57295.1 hypothetical protein HMPREF3151_07795 [Corynebacterium sp. HMSC05H05]OHR21290.1 hypothetical protein HMPREF2791_07985 [Corynebacterium sp. HMSC034A01]